MKKIITLLLAIYLLQTNVFSQTTVYYDHTWEAVKNKANALYYSKHEPKNADGLYSSRDYYIDDSLQMTGSYTDDQYKTKEGNFVWYFHTGKKNSKAKFTNGKLNGKAVDYFESGKVYSSILFKKGYPVKKSYYYENGNAQSEFHYDKRGYVDSIAYYYYPDGSLSCMINYNDSVHIKRENYYPNGQVLHRMVYNNNRIFRMKAYTEEGKKKKDSTITFVEPKYGDDEKDFENYIKKNKKYPQAARDNDLEGKVEVMFLVNTDGSISDIYLTTRVYYLLDDEAKRLILAMPKDKWKPATLNGYEIPSFKTVTIDFDLD